MDKQLFTSYMIDDRSYVSYIKREIHNIVKPVFTETRTAEIDIIISELTSNLVKYAAKGEILYRLIHEEGQPVFEVLCIDNGPGIHDIQYSSRDGISSRNSLGQGLGAISRLSNFSQVYSKPDWGTIVYSRICHANPCEETKKNFVLRCINVAKPGESVSGDGVMVKATDSQIRILVGDGLGHGSQAKEAVDMAIAEFNSSAAHDPAGLIRDVHHVSKKTRGLVATIATLDYKIRKWHLCGVGNISTRLQQGLEYKNYVCHNGIVGMTLPSRLENSSFQMEKMQQLIFCSDGIRTRWDLLHYPSILKYDPMLLAACIYKDHGRKSDDMTILILKTI